MKKETRKIEIIMAIIFMLFHIVMMVQMKPFPELVYVMMATIFAVSAWFLVARLAWDKFKKNL